MHDISGAYLNLALYGPAVIEAIVTDEMTGERVANVTAEDGTKLVLSLKYVAKRLA